MSDSGLTEPDWFNLVKNDDELKDIKSVLLYIIFDNGALTERQVMNMSNCAIRRLRVCKPHLEEYFSPWTPNYIMMRQEGQCYFLPEIAMLDVLKIRDRFKELGLRGDSANPQTTLQELLEKLRCVSDEIQEKRQQNLNESKPQYLCSECMDQYPENSEMNSPEKFGDE